MVTAPANRITVSIFSSRDQIDVSFPAHWAICPVCKGCATDRGASVEYDGGGFTSSEWAEQDDDFKQNYLSGVYDRPCGPCNGLGRVQVIDEENVTGWRERIFLKTFQAQERDSRAIDAIHAAERRMGA